MRAKFDQKTRLSYEKLRGAVCETVENLKRARLQIRKFGRVSARYLKLLLVPRFAVLSSRVSFSHLLEKLRAVRRIDRIFQDRSAATRPKNLRARKERAKADQSARPSLFRLGFCFCQSSPLLLTNQNFTLLKFSEATRRFAIFARSVSRSFILKLLINFIVKIECRHNRKPKN